MSRQQNPPTVTEVKGTITMNDKSTREFSITREGAFQWGNSTTHLGDSVEALQSLEEALVEHFGNDLTEDDGDDGDDE